MPHSLYTGPYAIRPKIEHSGSVMSSDGLCAVSIGERGQRMSKFHPPCRLEPMVDNIIFTAADSVQSDRGAACSIHGHSLDRSDCNRLGDDRETGFNFKLSFCGMIRPNYGNWII